MVKTIKSRDACLFKRDTVHFLDEVVESLRSLSAICKGVEYRTDLVGSEDRVTCRCKLNAVCESGCSNLSHLTDFLLKCHSFENLLDLRFDFLVLRDCRGNRCLTAARCSDYCSCAIDK